MISRWSSRRKFLVSIIILLAVGLFVGIPVYLSTRDVPNCSNGKLDGDETGIDCGGSCQLLCTPEILPVITRGDARLLKIATSTYETAILVVNPNLNGRVVRAPYTFSIYSSASNKPVKVVSGDTYIGRSAVFALFAGPFTLDDSGTYRAVFAFSPNLVWEKNTDPLPSLIVGGMNLVIASSSAPSLEASIANHSQSDVSNVEVVALLSDASGNTVAVGKTFVDSIAAGGSAPVSFSWPNSFARDVVSINIIPHALPDRSYIH